MHTNQKFVPANVSPQLHDLKVSKSGAGVNGWKWSNKQSCMGSSLYAYIYGTLRYSTATGILYTRTYEYRGRSEPNAEKNH